MRYERLGSIQSADYISREACFVLDYLIVREYILTMLP